MSEYITLEKRTRKLTSGTEDVDDIKYNQIVLITLLWGGILHIICLSFLPNIFMGLDIDLFDAMFYCIVAGLWVGVLFMASSGLIMNIIGFTLDSISIGCFFSMLASQILYKAIMVSVIEVVINILLVIFLERLNVILHNSFWKYIGYCLVYYIIISCFIIICYHDVFAGVCNMIFMLVFSIYLGLVWRHVQRYTMKSENAIIAASEIYLAMIIFVFFLMDLVEGWK